MSLITEVPQMFATYRYPDARRIEVRDLTVRVDRKKQYRWFWDKYEEGTWERETFEVLSRLLKPGSYYVDIGGWIGPTVLFAAALGARVVAFEPDDVAFSELSQNVRLNGWGRRVRLVHAALTAESGTATLRSSAFGNSESSLIATKVQRKAGVVDFGQSQQCETIAARSAARSFKFDRAALIKIDIEGGEYPLLPHLIPVLEGAHAPLLVSFHPGNVGVDSDTLEATNDERRRVNQEMIDCLKSRYQAHRSIKDGTFVNAPWEMLLEEHSKRHWLGGTYLFNRE